MSLQRRTASQVRCLVIAPGLLLAPFVLPTSVIIVLLVSSGLVVGLTSVLMSPADQDHEGVRPRRQYCTDALGPAVATGLTVVSLAAVTTISATMALLLVPVLVLCSPTIRDWLRARLPRSRPATPEQSELTVPAQSQPSLFAPAPIDPQQLTSMTDGELCLAWRASYEALRTASSPSTRSRVVSWRHACLDEIESRHPAALAAWLGSGARASSGPDRFLPPGPDRAA